MVKAPKRDAAYFERKSINEFPAAHADLLAGRYSSITNACKAVGPMSADTPMKALKRNWLNASSAEKKQFVAWIRARSPSATAVAWSAIREGGAGRRTNDRSLIVALDTWFAVNRGI